MVRFGSSWTMMALALAACAADPGETPASCDDAMDCAPGERCTLEGGCIAAEPTCADELANGDETGVDCGGPTCGPCPRGEGCRAEGDCLEGTCLRSVCVVGPTADFSVHPNAGPTPLTIEIRSNILAGDANTMVEYDYGEGAGFETTTGHTYERVGIHIVTQRVRDTNGFEDTRTIAVPVGPPLLPGCHLSVTDKSPDTDVTLGADRLTAEWWTLRESGVRSDCAITPGSGVYYVEASTAPPECDRAEAPEACAAAPPWLLSFGVATADAPFDVPVGRNAQGFGIETSGLFFYSGTYQGYAPRGAAETYGWVVDYRGSVPTVHVIAAGEEGGAAVAHSQTLTTVSEEVYAMLVGVRRKVGLEVQVNFGNDLTNRPFTFDPVAALDAAGLSEEAQALTLGLGGTVEPPANTRPELEVSADSSVPLGATVRLRGHARDAEDGDLDEGIYWEDLATVYGERTSGRGPTFDLTPTQIGVHPIRATVFDADGGRRQAVVRVTVTGAVEQHDPVRLVADRRVDPNTGRGIVTDGLSAGWTLLEPMGIRANQGLYGDFWYFEATRRAELLNRGVGLVVWDGQLDPYTAVRVPPSVSVNIGASVWQSLIYLTDFDLEAESYGFAVDYRGENPIVYVIIDNRVVAEWAMTDAFVPVHPMLYGDAAGSEGSFDLSINFGASPFAQDPCAALADHGLEPADRAALELGWGDAHAVASCPGVD